MKNRILTISPFIKYLLKYKIFINFTMEKLGRNHLSQVKALTPSIMEQINISGLLKAEDIEKNRTKLQGWAYQKHLM